MTHKKQTVQPPSLHSGGSQQVYSPGEFLCISIPPRIILRKYRHHTIAKFALNFICDTLQTPYLIYEDILRRGNDTSSKGEFS